VTDPLVLTLVLDEAATERFDRERREHFPPGRTKVGAHLTLFHAVPGELAERVHDDVRAAVDRPAFDVAVDALVPLGRGGVAYRVVSPELVSLHRGLQEGWWEHLTRQDQQPLKPHVTVQNKAEPDVAAATLVRLQAGFESCAAQALGVAVWRYAGGPWEHLATHELG
jgi:2'-5' RNA ligase